MKLIFHTAIFKTIDRQLTIWSLVVVGFALLSQSCKQDDPKTESERIQELLTANTWQLQEVTIDNNEETTLFAGMTLQFTTTTYTTTNGGVVWPASGTWSFIDDTGEKILRSDDVEIVIVEITGSTLKLSLTWDEGTIGSGRVSSIAGNHVFVFVN